MENNNVQEDCIDCEEYNAQRKKEWERIASLKPLFDRARDESYETALKFWEDNLDPFCGSYFLSNEEPNPLNPEPIYSRKDVMTLSPANDTERELYNVWYLKLYADRFNNIEKAKENYLHVIGKSKKPLEYIASELERLNKKPERVSHSYYEVESLKRDYKLEGKEPDWKKITDTNIVHKFSRARLEVDLQLFLEEQQTTLNEGGIILTPISGSEKISWTNKTELCELIYTLHKSQRVLDNGKPITEKKLIQIFSSICNTNLSKYYDLLREGMQSYKKTDSDSGFFTAQLLQFAKDWKPKSKNNK
jgi:hypothetical protein